MFCCFLIVFVTALLHHIIVLPLRSSLLNQLFVKEISGSYGGGFGTKFGNGSYLKGNRSYLKVRGSYLEGNES